MKFTSKRKAGFSRGTQLRYFAGIFVFGVVLLIQKLNEPAAPEARKVAPVDETLDFSVRAPGDDLKIEVLDVRDGQGRPLSERFDVVEDRSLGLSKAEFEVAAAILNELDRTAADRLQTTARKDATFNVLMRQPELFRGELFQLKGDLRRLQAFPSLESYGGPSTLVEGWMFTSDSANNPYRILALAADAAIPRGETIEPVSVLVEGVFFKQYGYPAANSAHVAPMLLAKSIRLRPKAAPVESSANYAAVVIFAVVVVLSVVVIRLQLKERRRKVQFRVGMQTATAPTDVDDFENPGEFLERLSQTDLSEESASTPSAGERPTA